MSSPAPRKSLGPRLRGDDDGAWRTLDGAPTRIIAHRGASGLLPEHTLAGYELALQQGADVVEPDLLPSADGVLMARHDAGLARSTDVAQREEFAVRRVDGDWPITRFTRAELATLRARQPFAQRDRLQDGRHAIPDFDEILAWAEAAARERGAPVRLYPELKHPEWLQAQGLDPVPLFAAAMRGVDARHVQVWTQCFEAATLARLREATGLPAFLLLEDGADWRAALVTYRDTFDGFAVAKSMLDRALVDDVHAAGLAVHAWTYRDDVLPDGVARVQDELEHAFALGVDAVFCDFPATGLAARAARITRPPA
jgi:glycerophosphoryl diester phosphodiesterase